MNLISGGEENESFTFTGSEGTLEIAGTTLNLTHVPRPKVTGYTIGTFTEATQKQFLKEYNEKNPVEHPVGAPPMASEKFVAPRGYSDSYDHFHGFFDAVRSRKAVIEDGVFGLRAAGAALLSNLSIERGSVVEWDPETMKLAKA